MTSSKKTPIHFLITVTSMWILIALVFQCEVSPGVMAAQPDYVIETLVVVDLSGVRKWMSVTGKSTEADFRLELNSTFYEVSQLFRSLETYGLKIEARIKQWTFLNQDIFQTHTYRYNGMAKRISAETAADVFKRWVQQQGYSFDFAVLYTGFDISSTASFRDSTGYAYIGGVCTNSAVAVVEIDGLYQAVLTTAHEMGHSLGAEHDGSRSAMSCSSSSGHLMNPSISANSINHFYFSSCSAYQIKSKLSQLNQANSNCLVNIFDSLTSPGPRFGEFQSADEICKRAFGSYTYVARQAYESYGDNVCLQLACMTQTTGTNFYWKFTLSPPGLPCGQNKRCSWGQCVTSSNGPSMTSDLCPYGDQPKIEGDYQTTCATLAPLQCSGWEKACCHSCRLTSPGENVTADEVCRRVVGTQSSLARKAYSYYGDQLCKQLACLTSVRGTYFSWNYVNTPDGLACGRKRRCYQGRCVYSQTGSDAMSDTCPYGDQPWIAGDYQTTCGILASKLGCRGWENICCNTCHL